MSVVEMSSPEGEDVWHVQLRSGEVRAMTLDVLDTLFQEGIIDEETYVRREGATAWAKLGEVAGVDEAPPPIAPPAPEPRIEPRTPEPRVAPATPMAVVAPIESYAGPESTAPFMTDTSDLDENPFRPRKRRFVVALAAVLALGGAAFGVTRFGGLSALAALASPPPAPPPTIVQAPVAPVATVEPTAPKPAPASLDTRLTDDQRRALLDVDKTRAEAAAKKRAATPVKSRRAKPSRHSGKPVFHKGGDAHDPLNSAL